MNKYRIEYDPNFILYNYFVFDEDDWAVAAKCTLWGAKRWIKKRNAKKVIKYDALGRVDE